MNFTNSSLDIFAMSQSCGEENPEEKITSVVVDFEWVNSVKTGTIEVGTDGDETQIVGVRDVLEAENSDCPL